MRGDALLVFGFLGYVAAGIACGAWAEPVLREMVNERLAEHDVELRLTLIRAGLLAMVVGWPIVVAWVFGARLIAWLAKH